MSSSHEWYTYQDDRQCLNLAFRFKTDTSNAFSNIIQPDALLMERLLKDKRFPYQGKFAANLFTLHIDLCISVWVHQHESRNHSIHINGKYVRIKLNFPLKLLVPPCLKAANTPDCRAQIYAGETSKWLHSADDNMLLLYLKYIKEKQTMEFHHPVTLLADLNVFFNKNYNYKCCIWLLQKVPKTFLR